MRSLLKKSFLVLLLPPLFTLAQPGQDAQGTSSRDRMNSWKIHQKMIQESPFSRLKWMSLGPSFQGGRVESIHAVPGTAIIYAGFGSGGVWKTVNNGLTWVPIFDHQPTCAIGDLAVSESHPDTLYVGTGESLLARSSFAGMGIFKSRDGGNSWSHMGLEDTHHIGRVVIHPQNPDVVYAAALGHEYTPNKERGLFRSRDGGNTWEKVLYISDKIGIADVAMDPEEPDILYASSLEHGRKPWNNYESNAALYKSRDGGDTWSNLTEGLPTGPKIGRIAPAVAPSDPRIVYAFLSNGNEREGQKGDPPATIGPEVYRSRDKGETWVKVPMENDIFKLHSFADICVSPDNPDCIYVLGVNLLCSEDGGQTCRQMEGTIIHINSHPARALHLDQHDLWIDPENSSRLILGNDGGVYISEDKGKHWLHCNNIPVGEFYALSLGRSDPYLIYGGTQDNAALFGPAGRLPEPGIDDPWRYVWIDLWGGGDSYFTFADPTDSNIIYFEQQFGNLQRKDMKTGRILSIRPRLRDKEPPLRFNWMSPFIISPHNPLILYFGADRVFKSFNRGDDWYVISPDLTSRPGPEKQGNVPYGTITAISESPLIPGLLYVGTDDGRVWKTENSGVDWMDIGRGLPDKWISRLEASCFEEKSLYLSLTGYREDDFRTYLYKSDDSGASWISIGSQLPDEPFNVIREDPAYRNTLYAGSDQGGVYMSRDGGSSWVSLCADLPTAAVHDIAVHPEERELVIATHGRSIFKTDLLPIDEFTDNIMEKEGHLFSIRPALLPRSRDYGGDWAYETGKRAVIHYYLKNRCAESPTVSILNQRRKVVRVLKGSGEQGINRLEWDLAPDRTPGNKGVYEPAVVLARPGSYSVEIRCGDIFLSGEIRVDAPVQSKVGRDW